MGLFRDREVNEESRPNIYSQITQQLTDQQRARNGEVRPADNQAAYSLIDDADPAG
jgi:hypothetical protein